MVYEDVYAVIGEYLRISTTTAVVLFSIISIWSLVWKGLALWKSAKKNHLIWFVVLLVVNTIGILEILYIFVFSKIKLGKATEKTRQVKKAKK